MGWSQSLHRHQAGKSRSGTQDPQLQTPTHSPLPAGSLALALAFGEAGPDAHQFTPRDRIVETGLVDGAGAADGSGSGEGGSGLSDPHPGEAAIAEGRGRREGPCRVTARRERAFDLPTC